MSRMATKFRRLCPRFVGRLIATERLRSALRRHGADASTDEIAERSEVSLSMAHISPLGKMRGKTGKIGAKKAGGKTGVLQKAIQCDTLPAMKKPKTFRLSEQAQNHLVDVVKMTGTNETAIVEMALAFLANKIRDDVVSHISNADPLPSKKKRKRR